MDELLNSVRQIVNDALTAAGKLAGEATDAASDVAEKYVAPALAATQEIYNLCLASGMTPEDAADATEAILRDITGRVII